MNSGRLLFGLGLGSCLSGALYHEAQVRTDFAVPMELIIQIEAWGGRSFLPADHIDRSRETRRQFINNLLEVSRNGSNYDLIYNEVMMMRHHLDPSQKGDLFLELPFLYARKVAQYIQKPSGANLTNYRDQAGFHYALFTRQLCRAYLLREGHFWTYFRHLW